MRILLCDSDPASRATTQRVLQTIDPCEVVVCVSGADAIERLERERFDALLIETELPLLDGFETLELVRQSEHLRTLPVVVITSDRSREAVVRSLELSVTDYLLKPVRRPRLEDALSAICARARQAEQPAPPPPLADADPRPRVLIVDGDEGFRESLRSLLDPHALVSSAGSGAAALNDAWSAVPAVALIGHDTGPIGPSALARFLARLGTPCTVRIATPDEIAAEEGRGAYSGVIGRSSDPDVVLRDLQRFLPLPARQTRGLLQKLLEELPPVRDLVIRTTASVFTSKLGSDVEVRDTGATDVIGVHAVVKMSLGSFAVWLAVQCTTELIRELAVAGAPDGEPTSSVSVLGEIAGALSSALRDAAAERSIVCECGEASFVPGASAREGLPPEAERLVVEMAPPGSDGRFRVVLDVYDAAAAEEPERLTA